jgi:hypothetical protein
MTLEAHECRGLSGVVRPYARGQQLHHAPPLRHLQALQRLAVYSALYEVCSVIDESDSVMHYHSVRSLVFVLVMVFFLFISVN